MKTIKHLPLLLIATLSIGFSACGSDDDEKNDSATITGYWSADNGHYSKNGTIVDFKIVYNFLNYNTLTSFGASRYILGTPDKNYSTVPGHPDWYITSSEITRSYYRTENKIFISNGDILTIDGNRLLEDGSNIVYTRW